MIQNKKIIYTAVIGGYDRSRRVPKFTGWDYKCLIDSDFNLSHLNNKQVSVYAKTHPHLLFPEYDISVWVDGNAKIINKMDDLSDKDITMVKHAKRSCIYEELRAIGVAKKASLSDITKQIEYYRLAGMPCNNGMIASGFIVRRHNLDDIKNFDELWWKNFYSGFVNRDQPSLAFTIWKTKINLNIITCRTRDKYIRYYLHKKNKK